MKIVEPFHSGELAVQEKLGERHVGTHNGSVIADEILPGALPFIEQQRFMIAAWRDNHDSIWAAPWFFEKPALQAQQRRVTLDTSLVYGAHNDCALSTLNNGDDLGVLFIELTTRRRYRVNASARWEENLLHLDVREAYPNCPRFIQRHATFMTPSQQSDDLQEIWQLATLDQDAQATIQEADTLFIATAHSERGADASHRGGPRGFVEVVSEREILIPDYSGNSMYNTLGNIFEDPSVGVTFVDPDQNTLLQVSGKAEIIWERDGRIEATGGTGRWLRISVEQVRRSKLPVGLGWESREPSPFNPG